MDRIYKDLNSLYESPKVMARVNLDRVFSLNNQGLLLMLQKLQKINNTKLLIRLGCYIHEPDNLKLIKHYFPNTTFLYGHKLTHILTYKEKDTFSFANSYFKLNYSITFNDFYSSKLCEWYEGKYKFKRKWYSYIGRGLVRQFIKKQYEKNLKGE